MRDLFLPLTLGFLATVVEAQQIKEFKFDITTLGGQKITEQTFANNVLIVDVWGTWCPPCREAVPTLEAMYRKYKHHGLEIVGFNYERGASDDAAKVVRKFASDQGLSYHLAIGTPAIQQQIPNFRAYPTLLFFKKGEKGIEFDHLEVGLEPTFKKKLEAWIRVAVGLEEAGPAEEAPGAGGKTTEEEGKEGEEEKPRQAEPLAKGVIFKPGDGDTGFEFEAVDVDGKALKFADLKGKPTLLVLTSSWDGEAANAAKLTTKLAGARAESIHVVAASLEMKKNRDENVAAIKAFNAKNGVSYRVFPAGLGFQKKIHLFHGMPLFLVFDKEGTLVLRESGSTYEKIESAITSKLDELGK